MRRASDYTCKKHRPSLAYTQVASAAQQITIVTIFYLFHYCLLCLLETLYILAATSLSPLCPAERETHTLVTLPTVLRASRTRLRTNWAFAACRLINLLILSPPLVLRWWAFQAVMAVRLVDDSSPSAEEEKISEDQGDRISCSSTCFADRAV